MFSAGSSTTASSSSLRIAAEAAGPRSKPSSIRSLPSIGEVAQPVRARALLLDHLAEAGEPLDLLDRRRFAVAAALAEQVGALVVDQVERELVAVAAEETSRAARVAFAGLEHVVGARSARRAAAARSDT